jgi:hypothetical protein
MPGARRIFQALAFPVCPGLSSPGNPTLIIEADPCGDSPEHQDQLPLYGTEVAVWPEVGSRLQGNEHPLYRVVVRLVYEVVGTSARRLIGCLAEFLEQYVIDELHSQTLFQERTWSRTVCASASEPIVRVDGTRRSSSATRRSIPSASIQASRRHPRG